MLRDLHVQNLAVLAGAAVEFGSGLNILTGETGAGKSIVVDSLALLAGVRASSDLIRTGADRLNVTGVFEVDSPGILARLEAAGVACDGRQLVVRREISRSGRNRIFLNDAPITLRLLTSLAPSLLRIHTQRQELELLSPELQRRWLDAVGGEEGREVLEATAAAYREYEELERRLERLSGDAALRLERIDLLRFQAGEIDAADLEAGEEEALRRERDVLRHSEALSEALGTSLALLVEDEDSAADRLARAAQGLESVAAWEPGCQDWLPELEELRIRAAEVGRTIRSRFEQIEANPVRLDAIEERLAQIERLCRKYGSTTGEVLRRRQEMARELEELEGGETDREALEARRAAALERYRTCAFRLSQERARWGEVLADRVHRELSDLALARARFGVRLARRRRANSPLVAGGEAVDFSAEGLDQVTFEFTPNPGEAAAPLARIASGGELSRVHLALRLAVGGRDTPGSPTLVFDEVDSGIGGAEAAALGRMLHRLGADAQVLVVTHLPQVASHADHHFRVRKQVRSGRTTVRVDRLDAEARVEEVARMLAGKTVGGTSRSHAEALIADARGS